MALTMNGICGICNWLNVYSPITSLMPWGGTHLDNGYGGNELNRSLKRHSWGKPPANDSSCPLMQRSAAAILRSAGR